LTEDDKVYTFTTEEDIDGIGRFYLKTSSKALGNDDFAIEDNITIYTTNESDLKIAGLSLGDNVRIELFDTLGKEVGLFEISNSELQHTFNLRDLPKGVYFVKVNSSKISISKKIALK
jgi:hypothetical protein